MEGSPAQDHYTLGTFYDGPEVVDVLPDLEVHHKEPDDNQHAPSDGKLDTNQQRWTFGLRPVTFWLVVALFVVVILAITIGAGVGASQAHRNSSTSTDSSLLIAIPPTPTMPSPTSATQTSSNPSSIPTVSFPVSGSVELDCPGIDNSIYQKVETKAVYTFQVFCGVDLGPDNSKPHPQIADFTSIIAYSLDSCMDACAQYNVNANNRICVAVTFSSNLTAASSTDGPTANNCFLENSTAATYPADKLTKAIGVLQD